MTAVRALLPMATVTPPDRLTVFVLKDVTPEQFVLVEFDDSDERVETAVYLPEDALRTVLSHQGIAAEQIEEWIRSARHSPV